VKTYVAAVEALRKKDRRVKTRGGGGWDWERGVGRVLKLNSTP